MGVAKSMMIAMRTSFGCFFLRPIWVVFCFVMSWPHSGQLVVVLVFVFRLLRLYLHFLQCVWFDVW